MKICDYCGAENDDAAVNCRSCGTQNFKTATGLAPTPVTAPPERKPEPESSPSPAGEFRELTPREKEMDLVTLLTCRTLADADLVVSELRSAEIDAFIPDECLSQAVAWNVNTYGFVRVQVSPKDYDAAKTFLLAKPQETGPGGLPGSS